MEFNDKIHYTYTPFHIYFNMVKYHSKPNKYIMSLYNKTNLIIRGEYILLGSYSTVKNFWIWSDQSFTLDKSMVKDVKNIRTNLLNENSNNEISSFIKKNYTIITLSEIKCNCNILDKLLKSNIVLYNTSDEIIDVILITKILQNNIN
jgi:hypothetical protein